MDDELALPPSTLDGLTTKVGDGDWDQGIDAGREVESHAAGKDTEKSPNHGPAIKRPRCLAPRNRFGESCRGARHRHAKPLPFRIPPGIPVDVSIAEANGHTGRGVTAD